MITSTYFQIVLMMCLLTSHLRCLGERPDRVLGVVKVPKEGSSLSTSYVQNFDSPPDTHEQNSVRRHSFQISPSRQEIPWLLALFLPLILISVRLQPKMMKRESPTSCFLLLLFLYQGCEAQDTSPVQIMQSIWSSLGGSPTLWKGTDICNNIDYKGVTCDNASRPNVIDLSQIQLNGTIPPLIGNLTSLNSLHLGANQIHGRIPDEICALNNLLYLNLGTNQLEGPIPLCIGNLTALQILYLDSNRGLNGTIPSLMDRFKQLTKLNMGITNISGSIPDAICSLTKLTFLNLGTTNLSGSILPCISNLTSMEELYLDNNRFQGGIPDAIINLPQLKTLSLSGNSLNGTVSGRNKSLSALDNLDLSRNELSSVGYINVSHSCNFGGNQLLCSYKLRLAPICYDSLSPCKLNVDSLYNDQTWISTSQAEVNGTTRVEADAYRLYSAARRGIMQVTIRLLSAVILALSRNTTSFEYNSPDVSVNLQTYNQSSLNGSDIIESKIANTSVAVTLPVSIIDKEKASVALSSVTFNPFSTISNESVYSPVVGVSVYRNGQEIDVRNVTQLINISMGIIDNIPDGYKAVCQYWNETETEWQREGLTMREEGRVTMCQSTHLTNFSIGIMPIQKNNSVVTDTMPVAVTEENKTKTLIIILVCSIVGGLILILIISVLIYRNFQLRQRKHMETSLSVMVDAEEIEYERKIAEGKRGQVWKCTYKGTTTVMVKKLTKDIEIDRECQMLKYLGNGLRERYIMMEWMEGGSLHDYLSASSDLTIETIGQGVSKGLSYITSMGMVHTAVVPKKILLSGSHTTDVKLQCLMCVVTEDAPYEGKQRGLQTSPEIEKKKRYQTSGHVWSVGVLLWAMVTHNSHLYDKSDGSDIDFTTEGMDESLAGLIRDCTEETEEKRPSLSQVTQRMMTEKELKSLQPRQTIDNVYVEK
ncbi:putative LRR receptor-like serine/threonine-protein kinase [Planoprotostelium fungivorum]|uniref:Putative LRR receptor-like serine/threonine-protein kinase n=1 Tax=Planoprotostelium fungivorum TaxID=1890364 RepID=A0A2P6MN09_9EUKA|nr:putative LRR receptor-like serine/threonine-protein kinase [Planoprotostelium fungivorum]